MIIQAAKAAFENMFAPRSRTLLFKILGSTILFLIGIWFGFQNVIAEYLFPALGGYIPELPSWLAWLSTVFIVFAAIGSALALALLISPITALIAGFFIDAIAEDIEQKHYPNDPPGRNMAIGETISYSLKFLAIVLVGNLFALLLLLVPGVNLIAFFVVNGYLLGREYFEFAALRHHSPQDAKKLRSRHSTTVFFAGLVIAGFLSVPLLNFLTPFFAAGMMVHLYKMIMARSERAMR
ncbi:MAG: sulfate transporter family protein [Lentilitoribacter sp.]